MVFAHIPKAQLLFALLSETFLTIRQNSLNVTVCMIARSSCRGYFIHSLSTLYYYNAPSLATRLTGDYRDRTYTGKCSPALLDTHKKRMKRESFLCSFLKVWFLPEKTKVPRSQKRHTVTLTTNINYLCQESAPAVSCKFGDSYESRNSPKRVCIK